MPLLPSLIKRVDEFLKVAEHYSLVSLGADDMSLLAELMDASKGTVNPEVSYNLKLLRAMYQKALEINGGFRTIYQAIQGMLEDLDPEEEESVPISRLLNQISNQIEKRAVRSDSPGDMRELQMAASTVRAEEDSPFTYEDPEEEEGGMSAYESSLLGYSGVKEEGDEKEEIAKFLPGGASPETSGGKRGWGVGKAYTYKDWAEVYNSEREKYDRDLNGPAELLSTMGRRARNDIRIQSNLRDLIKVLEKLSALSAEAVTLENQIAIETEIEHPQEEAKLAKIHEELRKLEAERNLLKRNLNKFYKQNEIDSIRERINQPETSPQQRRLLEEKLKLQELRISGKYGYGKEAKERVKLIEALTADPNLSLEQFKKMEEAINGAAQFTDRMTKAQYDRIVTEQRGKEQARQQTPSYEPTRGGARVPMEKLPEEKQIDLEKASFSALVYQFQIDIASATQAARQAIYRAESGGGGNRRAKAKENPEYKKIIDEISDAIRKRDRVALYAAQNKLVTAVSNDAAVQKNQLKGYVDVLKLEPHFRKVLESIKDVTKTKKGATPKLNDSGDLIEANLTEQDKEVLTYILNDIHRLRLLYSKYYTDISGMTERRGDKPSSDWWKIKQQVTPRFKKVIEDMGRIEVYLNLKLHIHKPETKQRYPERSEMLKEILEQDKKKKLQGRANCRFSLLKLAQEVTPEQEVDQATADRLANEIFDKIFDETYQRMFSELQA